MTLMKRAEWTPASRRQRWMILPLPPTKGTPCASSSCPGAIPTTRSFASNSPLAPALAVSPSALLGQFTHCIIEFLCPYDIGDVRAVIHCYSPSQKERLDMVIHHH